MMDTRELTDKTHMPSFTNGFESAKRKIIQHLDAEIRFANKYMEVAPAMPIVVSTLTKLRTDIEEKFDMTAGW